MTDRNAGIIGELAARAMDNIEESVERGALGEDTIVVDAMLIIEVAYTDDDGDACTSVSAPVHSKRTTIALGLAQRAIEAHSDGDWR